MSNRRTFLKRSALFGAGAALLGRMSLGAAPATDGDSLGELTALALVDDALHLAQASGDLTPALQESLTFGINVYDPLPGNAAFFGRLMPARREDIIDLLSAARAGWDGRSEDDRLELKLALVAGWLVQRAGAAEIGPSLAGAADAAEARAQQDAAVVRARSRHLDAEATQAEIASLFQETAPRSLIRFHTLVPDYDDGEGWVTRLVDWRKAHAERMDRYARAVLDTDSEAHRSYVAEPNFLDPTDPIVLLAEQVRRGETPSSIDLRATIDLPHESLYGRALARGLGHVLSASAYLDGTLDARGVEERLAQA